MCETKMGKCSQLWDLGGGHIGVQCSSCSTCLYRSCKLDDEMWVGALWPLRAMPLPACKACQVACGPQRACWLPALRNQMPEVVEGGRKAARPAEMSALTSTRFEKPQRSVKVLWAGYKISVVTWFPLVLLVFYSSYLPACEGIVFAPSD